MIIIWGERLYGRVDQVGKQFHVATRFFHLWYIPLIPMETFVVINGTESDGGFKGVGIPMSLKSVLTAYARAALLITAVVTLFMGGVSLSIGPKSEFLVSQFEIAMGIACSIGLWATYKLLRADDRRAEVLAQHLGLNPYEFKISRMDH